MNRQRPRILSTAKEARGRSGFDIRHKVVANAVYELPFGRGRIFGGWQISAVASAHSNVPFTPVLSFDNADLQSLLTSELLIWLVIRTLVFAQTAVK
jgi:hypothetical protein